MLRSTASGILVLLILLTGSSGLFAQKFLLLERPGTVKNYKYEQGNKIIVLKKGDHKKISGELNRINDSVILIDYLFEVKIADIEHVYKVRWISGFMTELGLKAGLGYFVIDVTNHIISNNYPVFEPSTLTITGGLLATAVAFHLIRLRKFDIGENWRLRVIDFNKPAF
jgi:hypothetical protein